MRKGAGIVMLAVFVLAGACASVSTAWGAQSGATQATRAELQRQKATLKHQRQKQKRYVKRLREKSKRAIKRQQQRQGTAARRRPRSLRRVLVLI